MIDAVLETKNDRKNVKLQARRTHTTVREVTKINHSIQSIVVLNSSVKGFKGGSRPYAIGRGVRVEESRQALRRTQEVTVKSCRERERERERERARERNEQRRCDLESVCSASFPRHQRFATSDACLVPFHTFYFIPSEYSKCVLGDSAGTSFLFHVLYFPHYVLPSIAAGDGAV